MIPITIGKMPMPPMVRHILSARVRILGQGRLPLRSILYRRRARAHGATREARVLPGTGIFAVKRPLLRTGSDPWREWFSPTRLRRRWSSPETA